MQKTEWGKRRIASDEYRAILRDIALVQRDRHKTPEADILDGLRMYVALELTRPGKKRPPFLSDPETLDVFIAQNRPLIDEALRDVLA